MKLLENMTSLFAWMQIMASPTLIGGFAGFMAFMYFKGILGICLLLALSGVGIALGIFLAEKARRNKGTVEFMARLRKNPELEDK